jgi:hypothetical protein
MTTGSAQLGFSESSAWSSRYHYGGVLPVRLDVGLCPKISVDRDSTLSIAN